jgi:hypothetical protein
MQWMYLKAESTRDVDHARGVTPILPIYLLLVSCSGHERSCRIYGSRQHGVCLLSQRLPTNDGKSNKFDSPTLRVCYARVGSCFFHVCAVHTRHGSRLLVPRAWTTSRVNRALNMMNKLQNYRRGREYSNTYKHIGTVDGIYRPINANYKNKCHTLKAYFK